MSLPRRNIVVRILYAVLLLGMAVFLADVAITTFDEYAGHSASDPTIDDDSTASDAKDTMAGFHVAGISQSMALNHHMTASMTALWERFAAQDLATATGTPEPAIIYVAYHRSDANASDVSVTIGYPVRPGFVSSIDGVTVVTIPPAQRLRVRDETALDYWAPANRQTFIATADFDVYQLDQYGQVKGQIAYPARKTEKN